MTGLEIAALGSLAVGAYNTFFNEPDRPPTPTPPQPQNYYIYNDDGTVAAQQTWNPQTNGYEYRAFTTEEQRADRTRRQERINTLLNNLNQAPEDRIRAYDEYERTIASDLQRTVTPRLEGAERARRAYLEQAGMTGSRYHAVSDTEAARARGETELGIANQARLGRERLAEADRNFWLNQLQALQGAENADVAEGANLRGTTMAGAGAGTNATMNAFTAQNQDNWNDYNARLNSWNRQNETLLGTSTGLAYMGGLNRTPRVPNPGSPRPILNDNTELA